MKHIHTQVRATLVLATLLGAAAPALAQRGDSLHVGARYRVTLTKFPDRVGPQLPPDRWLAGELVERRGDTLVLRPHPSTGSVSVPAAAIDRLEASRGVSRAASAFENAVGGGVVGALWGWLLYDSFGLRGANFHKPWQAAGISAAVGAGGGLVAGLIAPVERWRRVAKPPMQ